MKKYLRHALDSTFAILGGYGAILAIFAIPIVGFAIHYWQSGWVAMSEEFQVWWVYGLQATGVVAIALYLWNLACAPYRMERDGRIAAEADVLQLRSQIPKAKRRRLNGEQIGALVDAINATGVRPDSMNVLYCPTSDEAAEFAADIGDAIRRAGIECSVHNGVMCEHDVRDRGIKIIHTKMASLVDLARNIQSCLVRFGYHPEKRVVEGNHKIFLYIARSPEDD